MPPKVIKHFKKSDPILFEVIKRIGAIDTPTGRKGKNYFLDLIESIVSQQLSGKAADKIFERFKTLFSGRKITPETVLKLKDEKIRKTGISYSKVKYIKDLASKVASGELLLQSLPELEDEKIVARLVQVKGIGRWTAEMFLIFTLGREDVFSHGDLGLNNAIKKIYKPQNHSRDAVEKIASKWSPYKSWASLILWRSLDNR